MANEEQLAILRQGVEVWNRWRKKNPDAEIDLSKAQLSNINLAGADLGGANLCEANLFRTNLSNSDLTVANLNKSDLREVSFTGADLTGSDVTQCDIRYAELSTAKFFGTHLEGSNINGSRIVDTNLSNAHLVNTSLCGAKLVGVNLSGADLRQTNFGSIDIHEFVYKGFSYIGGGGDLHLVDNFLITRISETIFRDCDLQQAIGLETIKHSGPSSISTDSFARSKGRINTVFLKGCGLSDWEIEMVKLYDPELSNEGRNKILYKIYDLQAQQAIQISPLFISYDHNDSSFVDKIEKYLEN